MIDLGLFALLFGTGSLCVALAILWNSLCRPAWNPPASAPPLVLDQRPPHLALDSLSQSRGVICGLLC